MFGAGGLERLHAAEQLVGIALRPRLGLQRLGGQPLVGAVSGQEHADLRCAQCEDEQPQHRIGDQEQGQVGPDEHPVEQRRERPGREDLPHDRVAAQPHHQIAGGTAQVEGVGQGEEVLEEAGGGLQVDRRPQAEQQPRPHPRREHGEPGHDRDRCGSDSEQRAVAHRHDAVHHRAGEQRQCEREQPQEHGGGQHPRQRSGTGQQRGTVAAQPSPQPSPQPTPGTGVAAGEPGGGFHLQRHARVGAAEPVPADQHPTRRRVHQLDAAASHPDQHHEVVQLPEQDRADRQQRDLVDVGAHPAGPQPELPGRVDQRCRARPVAAIAHDPAHRLERDTLPVHGQCHRQDGGTAIGQLRLGHERHPGTAADHRREPAHELPGTAPTTAFAIASVNTARWWASPSSWSNERSGRSWSGWGRT